MVSAQLTKDQGDEVTKAAAVHELNKALGGDVFMLGDDPRLSVNRISTGILPMDNLLEGGVARGRWTELFGDYSTMKSYIGYSTIAQAQVAGLKTALIDTEHAFDPDWAEMIGVDIDQMRYARPETAELAVDATEACIRDDFGLVVWDSVAAMAPQDEVAKRESGETHQPARLAALMSRAARKLTSANSATAMLYINQTRMNIGIKFGSRTSTPGGRALPFYASTRVSLSKGPRKRGERVEIRDGSLVKVRPVVATPVIARLEKSKLTKPEREVWFTFEHDPGQIDLVGYLIDRGVEAGAITQPSKGWYSLTKGKKMRLKTLRETVASDAALYDKLVEVSHG